jgi:hypothetical protein
MRKPKTGDTFHTADTRYGAQAGLGYALPTLYTYFQSGLRKKTFSITNMKFLTLEDFTISSTVYLIPEIV